MSNDGSFKRLSIVIRSYYRPLTLKETLKSIDALNYPKDLIEVIVVLDENDRGSFNVIEEIRSSIHYELKMILIDVNSATLAWNIGIKESKGDIIAILPDDVILHPETLNIALKYLNEPAIGMVGFPAISDNPTLSEKLHHWKYLGTISDLVFTTLFVSIFRREVLEKVGGYREDMGPPLTIHEDWELGSRIRKSGYKIIAIGTLVQRHLVSQERMAWIKEGEDRRKSWRKLILKIYSYCRAYVTKHWWSFLQVMKVSPSSQLSEYLFYFILPIAFFTLLILNPVYALVLVVGLAVLTIIYSFARGYYRRLSLIERIAYPLLLVAVRIARVYLAVIGYLYNKARRLLWVL